MEQTLWELQKMKDEMTAKQIELLGNQIKILQEQIKMLLDVVEDHENDMKRMAAKINELSRHIQKEREA